MTSDTVIEDAVPLQIQHIPSEFIDREDEQGHLQNLLSENRSRNLFVYGSRGTGKTHLLLHRLKELPEMVNTCYIPCRRYNTQYKALKQLYQAVTQEEITTGHHTSVLSRKIDDQTSDIRTVVILDDIDFLLLNDGDSLLYQLSRTNTEHLSLVLTSSSCSDLSNHLEERTLSSLSPQRIDFEPYTAEQISQILAQRSRDSLKPHSVHRDALTYIASTTENAGQALTWLKTTAQETQDQITEPTVKTARKPAYQNYIEQQLQNFTSHHSLLHQAIRELDKEHGNPVTTGTIYQRYQELCNSYSEDSVSNRMTSTYLKHLELLKLIDVEYHYGGSKGKTREIQLDDPTATH